MRVDVVDRYRGQSGIGQGQGDRVCRLRAVRTRRRHVVSVVRGGVAGHFGVDACAAPFGSPPLLQDEYRPTFRHDESVAVAIERAGRGGGIVVASGEHPDDVEGAKSERCQRRLHAAGEHRIGTPVLDETRGLADGNRAGGA